MAKTPRQRLYSLLVDQISGPHDSKMIRALTLTTAKMLMFPERHHYHNENRGYFPFRRGEYEQLVNTPRHNDFDFVEV